MKYPYISIDPIIAEVQSTYTRLASEGTIEAEKCYTAAVECIRLIGNTNYEDYSDIISIKGYSAHLNPGFYLAKEVWELGPKYGDCDIYDLRSAFICTTKDTCGSYRKNRRLFAGNSATLRYLHPDYAQLAQHAETCYIIKSKPNIITVTKANVTIGITYEGLKRDEKGLVMMQDEIHGIIAIKNYMLMDCLREEYIRGKLPRYIYKDIEQLYLDNINDAQDALKESSEEESYQFMKASQKRFDRFNQF